METVEGCACYECSSDPSIARRAKKYGPLPHKPSKCDCCGKETLSLVVDHCHDFNMVRGWICRMCNTGIGKLGDTLDGLTNALRYLEAPRD